MDSWLLLLAAVVLGLWVLVAAGRLSVEARRVRVARAAFLDALLPQLDDPRLRIEASGFPRLAGRFAGHAFDIQAVPDALTFRKLPALWLLVTLTEPQPLAGETRIMLRPTGLEPFSTFGTLREASAPPPGFPDGAVLRTTSCNHLPPLPVLEGLAPLFADSRLKEVVLAPNGLRLVRLAEEAPRGPYLLFRDADVGRTPAAPAAVRPMLEALLTVAGELTGAATRGRRHG